MTKREKLIERIMCAKSDAAVPFNELCELLHALGFVERVRGSHHIFTRNDVAEILNLQPKGSMAKAYQVKQIRSLLTRYRLGGHYA